MSAVSQMDVAIRPWSDGDLSLLERLLGDPAMTQHIGGPETPEKIRERHLGYCRNRDEEMDAQFAIVVGPESKAVGWVGYWEREWQNGQVLETGWSVLPDFQGKGIATRALRLLIERVRAKGKIRFMHAYPSVDNGPSNAICRKAGFTLQADCDFEYPKGHFMRCKDWRFDLFSEIAQDG